MVANTVKFQLSTNNVAPSTRDSPVHHFDTLVRSMRECEGPEDRNALLTFARAQMNGDVTELLYKHADVVETCEELHSAGEFGARGLNPKQLVNAKQTFWGVSFAFFIRSGP